MGKKKKSWGVNSKSAEARAKKQIEKIEKKKKKLKEIEDSKWVDEGSTAKEKRRKEREKKALEQAAKRAELKALKEKEEMERIKMLQKKQIEKPKLTAYQLRKRAEQREAEKKEREAELERQKARLASQPELATNVNQDERERKIADQQIYGDRVVDARTLDEAVSSLDISNEQNILKQSKGLYKNYYDDNIDTLKMENPTLRLSQLKDLMWKNWQKSPLNPNNSS